jgi:hypothetical protein
VLALRSYTGFQFTYGLPFVQAWLKGGLGAATGLMGVLLVQSGVISSLKPQSGGGVMATAIVFGSTQYLFTRLVDQHAQGILQSAGSPNDPATDPQTPAGVTPPDLATTSTSAVITPPGPTTASTGAVVTPPGPVTTSTGGSVTPPDSTTASASAGLTSPATT